MNDHTILKKAEFRFYEELNDLLPPERRKIKFIYHFKNNPSIKDAIESLGIPHTEVDLILINDNPVTFSYQLRDGDKVAVYPTFESLDISSISLLRKSPLRDLKFILDVHLGKLVRYMRMCGFDVYYNPLLDDKEIIGISRTEKRTILTRDTGLLKNKIITHGYWVRATDPKKQIIEILKRFDLFSSIKPFTRCLECNGMIISIEKEKIINKIPAKTNEYFNEFYTCSQCQKIYWAGSHFDKMQKLIEEFKPKSGS